MRRWIKQEYIDSLILISIIGIILLSYVVDTFLKYPEMAQKSLIYYTIFVPVITKDGNRDIDILVIYRYLKIDIPKLSIIFQ